MVQIAIIRVKVGVQPGVLELIAELTAENMLIAQVHHVIVVHLGRDKRDGCRRWSPLIARAYFEHMATARVPGETSLHAALTHVGTWALAIGIVRAKTIAHVSMAAHVSLSQLSGYHGLHIVDICHVGTPEKELLHQYIVIIAKLVSFIHQSTLVVGSRRVQVILHSYCTAGSLIV